MKVRFSRLALAELDRVLAELAERNPRTSARFLNRVEQMSAQLGRHPKAFQQVLNRPDVRRAPLLRYPYLMFYKVVNDEVLVLRIAHGARKEPDAGL